MKYQNIILAIGFIFTLITACTGETVEPTEAPASSMKSMSGDSSQATQQYAPLVSGLYKGGEVLFIHTETSDSEVAMMLTEMMGGPQVILVPELADAPPSMLASLYVFTNGIEGHGPFGFQQDIFDSVPGDEAYRPLRNVLLVEWAEGVTPRELRSVDEVEEAAAQEEVNITEPGIVVNFPVLVWPEGSR